MQPIHATHEAQQLNLNNGFHSSVNTCDVLSRFKVILLFGLRKEDLKAGLGKGPRLPLKLDRKKKACPALSICVLLSWTKLIVRMTWSSIV